MADSAPDPIRDPTRLRALAHPLRWRLIELIGDEGTATATRCAEVLGESVASCSYHLNMLAKYDFVTVAEGGQGREKPWRLTSRYQSFSADGLPLEGQLAAEAAGEAFVDFEFTNLKARMRQLTREPEEWRTAGRITASTVYLTAAELTELGRQVVLLVDQYEDRWDDPELRPEGARQVRLFTAMFPNPVRP